MEGVVRCRTATSSAWRRRRRSLPAGDRGGRENGEVGRVADAVERRAVRLSARECRRLAGQSVRGRSEGGRKIAHSATYTIAYVQHAPLEPRTAVAEWDDGKLTVWTARRIRSACGASCRGVSTRRRRGPRDRARFRQRLRRQAHGRVSVEAARIAKAAGKPVMLRWTREEEFTWAYFRPAAVIDMEASLDDGERLATWRHININSGGNSIESPYNVRKKDQQAIGSRPPLRHGSYRALASTANSFARESFMDEMAAPAGVDPLEFRLAHLDDPRLRPVLEEAAKRFHWRERVKKKQPNRGVGLACSIERARSWRAVPKSKSIQRQTTFASSHVCEAFDCGPVMNPDNLRNPDGRGDHHGPRPGACARRCSSPTARSRTPRSAATACRISRTCRRSKRMPTNRKDVDQRRRRRDADHRHRPGDRQRGVPRDGRAASQHADSIVAEGRSAECALIREDGAYSIGSNLRNRSTICVRLSKSRPSM